MSILEDLVSDVWASANSIASLNMRIKNDEDRARLEEARKLIEEILAR